MTSPLPASLALALAAAPLLARQHPAADPPGALPYEAAFDRRELLLSPSLAVTRDGNRVAYEVRQPPAGADLNARFLPNGTPSLVAGSKVLITDRAAARTFDACPGGSCWRPVWSPDGNALAFYSDLGGPPQLWVYDLAARKGAQRSPPAGQVQAVAGRRAGLESRRPDDLRAAGTGRGVPLAGESGRRAGQGPGRAGRSAGQGAVERQRAGRPKGAH